MFHHPCRHARRPFAATAANEQENRNQAAANAGWNYSSMNGMLCEVRLLTLLALSGTSGTPGVSSSFVAAAKGMNGECRQDYR
jgi:hypothetical protein